MKGIECSEFSLEFRARSDNSQIGGLLRDSIDTHVHFAPEAGVTRLYGALQTALIAREMGLRAIVLKNYSYPTAPIASLVSELVPDIAIFGSICLDYECGGLNAHAVEAAAKLGAKVVWMPVFSALNSKALVARLLGLDTKGDGISILGTDGKLVPEVVDILKIIRDYDMILATGHISAREIFNIIDKAKKFDVEKIVVTHAMFGDLSESILQPKERQMLAQDGVLIEHTFLEISPTGRGQIDPASTAAAIKNDGPSNCIMSSDSGGIEHPPVGESMRMFISAMLRRGLGEEEITCMVKSNPARLLGLQCKTQ